MRATLTAHKAKSIPFSGTLNVIACLTMAFSLLEQECFYQNPGSATSRMLLQVSVSRIALLFER